MSNDLKTSAQLIVLQGKYSSSTDFREPVNWINWKDKNLVQNQYISGKILDKLLKLLLKYKIISTNVYNIHQIFKDGITQTNTLLNNISSFISFLNSHLEYMEISVLLTERIDLESELYWANILESETKSSTEKKRINRLNSEIENLQKKLKTFEPHYKFLTNKLEDLNSTLKKTQQEIKQRNKRYIAKTREINKLKREIDTEKPKKDIYLDKTQELEESGKSDTEDYKRISSKIQKINTKVDKIQNRINLITKELLEEKSEIKKLKQQLVQQTPPFRNIEKKFNDAQQEYASIIQKLDKNTNERDNLVRDELQELPKRSNSPPPEHVRFSTIIKDELSENTKKLSQFLTLSELSSSTILKERHEEYTKKIQSLPPLKDGIKITTEDLKTIQKMIEEFERILNDLLAEIQVTISIQNFPLLTGDDEIPLYGYNFTFYKDEKPVKFEKLTNTEKIYTMWCCEYVLDVEAGITTHVYQGKNYTFKKTQKTIHSLLGLIEKLISKTNLETKFIITLKKPLLNEEKRGKILIKTYGDKK
jgi:predicted  nucleic acid-binding Zn-ribbon protein